MTPPAMVRKIPPPIVISRRKPLTCPRSEDKSLLKKTAVVRKNDPAVNFIDYISKVSLYRKRRRVFLGQ